MLAKNFKKYFLVDDELIASYEWVRDPFHNIPEGLSIAEEESFIDLKTSSETKRQFRNKSLFEFLTEIDDEISALKTRYFVFCISIFTTLPL